MPTKLDPPELDRLAREALARMELIPFDSFGPIDAVRSLEEYPQLSPDDRAAVLHTLNMLIKG